MELILNVFKKVKPEYREKYLQLFGACQQESLEEKGCIEYALFQSTNDENAFMIFERWASKEAHVAHTQTAHFKIFIDATEDIADKSERFDSERI